MRSPSSATPNTVIEANRSRLVQALRNVLQNAVEAYDGLDRPIAIVVRGLAESGRAVITIADEGCGMSDEARTIDDYVLPERCGYFLGARLVEPAVAAKGLEWAIRASAAELVRLGREIAATA